MTRAASVVCKSEFGGSSDEAPLRVGIVGTGWGLKAQLPRFREAGIQVVAIYSRDAGKAARLAKEHHIPLAFTSVEEMCKSDMVGPKQSPVRWGHRPPTSRQHTGGPRIRREPSIPAPRPRNHGAPERQAPGVRQADLSERGRG